MIQTDFDQRLRESAPDVEVPLNLSLHTANILADTQTRHRRRRVVWMGGALAVLLVAGGGTAAIAATGIAPWIPDVQVQAPSSAHPRCNAGFEVTGDNGTAPSASVVKTARIILKSIDLKALDTKAMQAYITQQNGSATDGATGQSSPVHVDADDLKQQALELTVNNIIQTRLTAEGYDPTQIGLSATIAGCGK